MELIINGKKDVIENKNISVTDLLNIKNVKSPEMVSVELNGSILNRENFTSTYIKNGDIIEFLYFMGGGSMEFRF